MHSRLWVTNRARVISNTHPAFLPKRGAALPMSCQAGGPPWGRVRRTLKAGTDSPGRSYKRDHIFARGRLPPIYLLQEEFPRPRCHKPEGDYRLHVRRQPSREGRVRRTLAAESDCPGRFCEGEYKTNPIRSHHYRDSARRHLSLYVTLS